MIAADTDRLTARLPDGYRARPFEDHDREPLVEEHNADAHPMEYQDAEEWRIWERMAPDDTEIRIVIDGPNVRPPSCETLYLNGPANHCLTRS